MLLQSKNTTSAASKPAAEPRRPPVGEGESDVFVYGSTPGGIAAALEAAWRGCRVVLACPQLHPGGMAASGLCTTDAVRRHLFGGFVAEFVGKVREEYRRTLGEPHPEWPLIKDGWYYAPSVAEKVFADLIRAEARISYLPGHTLHAVNRERSRVRSVELRDPKGAQLRLTARTFIDGTYDWAISRARRRYRIGSAARAATSTASRWPASTT